MGFFRYCEAITASLSRGSPYFTQTFIEQLSGLSDRLIAAPSLGKGGSWMGGKMTRPSLDKIGNWLEGHLTKFIAGEGDNSTHPEENKFKLQHSQGPFSHYSSISSAVPSADPSPYSSSVNLVSMSGSQPPPARTGSAMAMRSSTGSPHLHINRSSSAMDHVRPHERRSPVHRIGCSNTSTSFGQQKSAYGRFNGYGPAQETNSGLTTMENSPTNNDHVIKDGGPDQQASPWWGAYSEGPDFQTPTATTFMRVPENEAESAESSGFISLIDNSPMIGPSTLQTGNPPSLKEEDEEEEDLGLGNSSNRSKQPTPSNEGNGSASSEKPAASQSTNNDASRPGTAIVAHTRFI
jgi:hypothetical protein